MKCIVLAGGLGDKLWPLSRREYPKQFMNIREERSLLQETVGRNLSLCEEFFVMANYRHSFIVEGQMAAFQGLKYRCFYEEKPLGTAFPIVMACMSLNATELIYVINGDHFITGNTYQAEIVKAMDIARKGKFATFGAGVTKTEDNFEYFKVEDENKFEFVFKGSLEMADYNKNPEKYLVNTGLFICTAGALLNEVKNYSLEYFEKCKKIHKGLNTAKRHIKIENIDNDLESISLEKILYHSLENKVVIKPQFAWNEVDSYDVFNNEKIDDYSKNTILNDCNNISVINEDNNKLVVVNNIKDAVVVNTTDALYVTSKNDAAKIKNIIEDNHKYESYFNHGRVVYRPWGYRELLKSENNFMVRKVVILPSKTMDVHKHTRRSEHWSVVSGTATAIIGNERLQLNQNMSAFVPIGVEHTLLNETDENVVIIEVSVGENISDKDFYTIEEGSMVDNVTSKKRELIKNQLIKLEPAFKDYIWGGSKLIKEYGKKCDYEKLAESWELSAHEAGNSIVGAGEFKGRTFSDYLDFIGKEALGWKSYGMDRFPILIKFIDAKDKLSIQVHPDDEYAIKNENELGKNEMWYIMESGENSYLYCGFNRKTTKEEVERRVKDNTLLEILNKVKVKKGDSLLVKAGTIHAIGEGILLCEVQQNSNCTYRLYDYDRKDMFGNPRPLHLQKALDVINVDKAYDKQEVFDIEKHIGYNSQILASCKYFECTKYQVFDSLQIVLDETSFKSFIILEGNGKISDGKIEFDYKKGDSFFMPAGNSKINITGESTLLVTHI